MDASIRKLLASAEDYPDGEKNPALQQAYTLLRNVAETRPAVDTPESFGQDLYVLCAEFAFQNGQSEIARECLKMFFMRQPASNQFLCRSYLCQAQLLAPKNANKPDQLEKAVVYILKAISFAKKSTSVDADSLSAINGVKGHLRPPLPNYFMSALSSDLTSSAVFLISLMKTKHTLLSYAIFLRVSSSQLDVRGVFLHKFQVIVKGHRYHFLVYNASVIYWQFCRPFLKPGYRQYLARSLHQVVKALDDIEDKDYEWRAELMIALIQCHLDAHRRSDASHIASAAASFIRSNVPSLYKKVFGLMVRHQLVETAKLHKDLKTSPELAIFYKICKMKNSVDQEENKDLSSEIENVLNQLGVPHKQSLLSRSQERLSRRDIKPGGGAFSSSSSPSRDELEVDKKERYSKSPAKGGRRTPTPTTSRKIAADSLDKPLLLLELCRLCLEVDLPHLAAACVESMKSCVVKDQGFYLELEFVQCDLMVHSLGDRQETFQKAAIGVRLQAIKRCEEAILNSVRLGDPNVIQVGCVTQWNLCLPLLQANLRNQVRRPLTHIVEALEDIDSLLIQLRCQVHTELARCEEDQEQIQMAMVNLKKALSLDDGNLYQDKLEVSLRRLELRAQLYKQPDRPEDQAAMIIEQARKADSGTMRMKRSLLVKAGEALAPDAFLLVLDSENDTKDVIGGKGVVTKIRQLAGKALQFNHCVKKAEGHLKRLGDENDRERAKLWGDLAKTARKQEIWDVCRVACRFCLLYDDGRWKNTQVKRSESPKAERSRSDTNKEKEDLDVEKKPSSRMGSRPSTPQLLPLFDKELIRMMAEVSFINGEAFIQLLRSENVQLNDRPIPPEDKSKRPKGYIAKKPEEDPDWLEYCEWINELSKQTTTHFLHGLTVGIELDEPWIVCSAAAYIWNYNNHILNQGRHKEIVSHLTTVLQGLKKVGHAGETILLVNICHALAQGLIKPWLPAPPAKDMEKAQSESGESTTPKGKAAKAPAPAASKSKAVGVSISPDAMPDLKKAVEICEFAMQITNGDCQGDIVPIFTRLPILQSWVQAKQMSQHQISKTLGTDDESNMEGQRPMTRSIVATEMLSLTKNGIMEFKDVPLIGDIAQMIENAKWTDKFVELQLWTRLTFLAFDSKLHNMVLRCSQRALRFAAQGTQPRTRKMDLHRHAVEQEMLSYTSILLGQSLVENMRGKNSLRREAMEAFLNSAKFARTAGNYKLVMSAARHYWNTSIPLVNQPIERELIKEPFKIILECIATTADKAEKEEKTDEEKSEEEEKKDDDDEKHHEGPPSTRDMKDKKDGKVEKEAKVAVAEKRKEPERVKRGMIGKPEDDLTLRAAMYGVLFQSYADQGEWFNALDAIDQAVADMPRTKHRLLLFKHRVMVKAKLGRSVHMDIQKFKDESEDFVAQMWRRVALSSKEKVEQLASYQSAIEALENENNEFQKVEYLLEFGQWLYSNHFSLNEVEDQLEWASDILLNMKLQEEGTSSVKPETKKGKGSKKRDRVSSESKSSITKAKKGVDKEPSTTLSKTPDKEKTGKKGGSKRKDSAKSKASSDKRAVHLSGQDAKSEISDHESEINATDYIPIVKEADIGVYPANPLLTINDLNDVKQLDALIRSHILLAEVNWLQNDRYNDALLMAYGFLMRLWQVLISACANGIKEVVKNGGFLVKDDDAKSGKGVGKDKKDDKDKKKEEKPKPKRKGPVDQIPSDLESWAVYDWPDEGIEAFKMETLQHFAISQENIPKPMLTLHYTSSMIEMLRQAGYNHLALPILAYQDLLSRTVLHSNGLFKMIHLRTLEVCQELDLKSACQHHLRLLGTLHISEEDQALTRDEISQWKEKQVQVAREEQRVKETLAKMLADSPSRPKAMNTWSTRPPQTEKADDGEVELHLGKILGKINLPEIWTETAHLLISKGHYQRAREFLNEANIAAQAFNDKNLHAKILFLLGKLAYHEAQYGQAINLCLAAQELQEAEDQFWFETVVLLADATIKEKYDIQHVRMTKKLLVHAINEFNKLGDNNPNRRNHAKLFAARLETKLVKVHLESILHSKKNVNDPQVLKALLEGSERYESIEEQMLSLRCWRESIPVFLEHAQLLRLLGQEAFEDELKRLHFMQCLTVLRQAYGIAERVFKDCHTLFSLMEMKALSTPVERELSNLKIEIGEILTDVFAMHDKEMRNIQMKEERKMSITRLVEDFIREPPVYEDKEKQWHELGRIAGDEAVVMFLGAHSMCGRIPRLKAKSLVGLGRLLRIISERASPVAPPQWMVHDLEVLKMQLAAEEAEAETARAEAAALEATNKAEEAEEEGEKGPIDENANNEGEDVPEDPDKAPIELDEKVLRQHARYRKKIHLKKKQHDASKFLYMCSCELLSQALNYCLSNHFTDLAGRAAFEMVSLIGQFDVSAATMLLSLYQSCQASQILEHTLFMSQPDPVTSKLAALLHQRAHLLQDDITSNNSSGSVFTSVMSSLHTDWQAWKKIEVSTNHLDLLKEFPSNYNLVILQHSPEKNFLFGAILDRTKGAGPTAGGGSKGKGQDKSKGNEVKKSKISIDEEEETEPAVSRARIFGEKVDFSQLQYIISKLASHKKTVQGMLLKREYQRTQAAQRQKMLATLDDNQQATEAVLEEDKEHEVQDKEMEEEFCSIVDTMTQYLRPVLEPVCQSLRSSNTPLGSNPNIAHDGGKDKTSKEQLHQNECLILLADPDIMQLPLEACDLLQMVDGINAISRDFSLQLLYNRMQDDKSAESETKESKEGKGEGKKKAKEPTNFVTRIPGLREAKQKQAKIIPLDRSPQSWQASVNTMDYRFIVDPFLECAETETNKPSEEFNTVMEKYEQQFTPRWLGIPGDDHTASIGEWEIYMSESSSFIFYGMERLLSYIPPEKLSALNIPECNILFSFDLAETAKSFQRQSKLDVHKTSTAISLEAPVQMMMLASLTGIKCVLANQWNCTLTENANKFHKSMKYLLEKGRTTGQTMYMLQNPLKVYEEEKAAQKVTETVVKEPEPPARKKSSSKAITEDAKGEKGESKQSVTSDPIKTASDADPDKDVEEQKDLDMPKASRADYNSVCYGMPNLIVTQ